jgi:NADH dehydrogenase/NADH:ubiquinone oxidoreductase subunit G
LLRLTIDEIKVEFEVGDTLLVMEGAQKLGISIPTFCYHQNLLPLEHAACV